MTEVSEARADTCKPPDKGETQTIDPTDRPSRFAGIMERDYHHMPGWYSDTHSFLHLQILQANLANSNFYYIFMKLILVSSVYSDNTYGHTTRFITFEGQCGKVKISSVGIF